MSESTPLQPVVFTLGEAAKAAGVSKPTLSKAIAKGRLAADRQQDGSFQIQAAELFRAYPPKPEGNRLAGSDFDERETHVDRALLARELEELRQRLAGADAERDRERRQLSDQIEDLRRRLDLEGEERRKLTAILTDQRAKAAEAEPARAGFLARLFGRG